MNPDRVRELLDQVRRGTLSVEQAFQQLRSLPFRDLGFARVDGHRALRCGFPEVIFCQGKRTEEIARIAESIMESGNNLLATRATPEDFAALAAKFPDAAYHERARVITVKRIERPKPEGAILVLTAGTADIPVAEEARLTAEMMDNKVEVLYDVGVAGIHRLFSSHDAIQRAAVLIVVAGMEGALASVVGGLVDRPVIGVPTSVGYGASFSGIAPLLTMLNSCAASVCVVNIDNGFGAGYVASLINHTRSTTETRRHGEGT